MGTVPPHAFRGPDLSGSPFSQGARVEPVTILAIAASPRRSGNSERLLDEALAAATSLGARASKAWLCEFAIAPCVECGRCAGVGRCTVEDDFQHFYPQFMAVDRIILASPVFFMGISAQAKALIDRCQCLWERKYRLKQRIGNRGNIERKGYLIASAGSGLPGSFDCSRKVVQAFYRTLDMEFDGDVCVNNVNDKGDIDSRPEALHAAYELGLRAATP